MTTTMSTKQFTNKLNGLVRRAKNVRDDVQMLTEYGFEQANEHGNLSPLSSILLKVKPLKTIRTSTLESYIFAHVLNMQWSGAGDKKVLKKVKDKQLEVLPTDGKTWYDYDDDGINIRTIDLYKRVQSLLQTIDKIDKDDTVVLMDGQQDLASTLKAALSGICESESKAA